MPSSYSTIIYRNTNHDDPVELVYAEETLRKAQSRFRGRAALVPQVDLKAYQCRSVVDWIDAQILLVRPSQFWWINDRIAKLTGRKEYVRPIGAGAGGVASEFIVRFQEPNFRIIRNVLDEVEANYGFASPARITGIEVSIDFYPKTPGEDARARMHGVLIRHFFPTTQILRSRRMWPRFMPGVKKGTDYTIGRNEANDRLDIGDRMTPGMVRPPLYGSTYYVGEKDDSRAFWRIQNKVLDKQNIAAGTRAELPEKDKRARIEVALGPVGCREIGLNQFRDLETLKLTRLQKGFFQFMKPTFAIVRPGAFRPGAEAVKWKIEEYRKERFLNAGVLGLQIREDARDELKDLQMPIIRRLRRMGGTRVQASVRAGAGPYGTMIAYDELARKVEHALRHLQDRVWTEMGR